MIDDTIKRLDAIKELRCEYPAMPMFKSLREEWDIKTEGYRKAEEVIMRLPSADRPKVNAELKADFLKRQYEAVLEENKRLKAETPQWIPCSERMPETDNTNKKNEYDVLLAVRPKKHPERTPQVYIGKLLPVEGDDGSGNFWDIKTAPCEWTIWGWSYFQEPEVLAWMPLPKMWKGTNNEDNH